MKNRTLVMYVDYCWLQLSRYYKKKDELRIELARDWKNE